MHAPIRLPDRRAPREQRPMANVFCPDELPIDRVPGVGGSDRPLRRILGPRRACGYLTRDFTAGGGEQPDTQRGSRR